MADIDLTALAADENADIVDYCRNGMIAIRLDKRYRLRPPNVGEHRRLTMALQDATNALAGLANRSLAAADAATQRETALRGGAEVVTDEEALAELDELRAEATKRTREIADARGDLIVTWMQDVWDTLSLDGKIQVAEIVPARMFQTAVARQFLDHWLAVPLGSGGQSTSALTARR